MSSQANTKKITLLLPLVAMALFVALYFVATLLYPGGSQVDQNSVGFSWVNNYWCNLLNQSAMNGSYNPARPIAITATFILCASLSIFWFYFPIIMQLSKAGKLVIQLSGLISMSITMFLFTGFHDIVISVAGIVAFVALMGTFKGLYKSNWFILFRFGVFNLLLMFLNNYVYYTKGLLICLPVLQKITFASFLLWFCCINVRLYRRPTHNTTL